MKKLTTILTLLLIGFNSYSQRPSDKKIIDSLEKEIVNLNQQLNATRSALFSCYKVVAVADSVKKAQSVPEPKQLIQYNAPSSPNVSQTISSTPSSSGSHQCLGRTKKGVRCSRMVSSGSYCWQHG